MKLEAVKLELINWIADLNDEATISKILALKKEPPEKNFGARRNLYGSGKHLIKYVAEDFTEPTDMFKDYEK